MTMPPKPKLGPLENRMERTPKAKTPQTCRRCKRTIPKGERYHLVIGQRGTVWKYLISCSECHAAARSRLT